MSYSYCIERVYLVQDNRRRLYNICADLNFGPDEKQAIQTLNKIFTCNEYFQERMFIYETFCKRAESNENHKKCLYHKGKDMDTPYAKNIFSRNGSSAGTTVSKSRTRIQCIKCRLSLLLLDTEKLTMEGGQIERTVRQVNSSQISPDPLPPGFYLTYAETLLKALEGGEGIDDPSPSTQLTTLTQSPAIILQPRLKYATFCYTRNPRFGVSKDIQVFGVMTSFEHLQYFYDHSPVQNICHGLPIAPFPQVSCLGVYFFVNDLKYRRIVTDGPNAFAITVHPASYHPTNGQQFTYTCWYCCYPEDSRGQTEWIPYQTANSIAITCI